MAQSVDIDLIFRRSSHRKVLSSKQSKSYDEDTERIYKCFKNTILKF